MSQTNDRPLMGKSIVVTRAQKQASVFVDRLNELGATTIELPLIEIQDPSDGGKALQCSLAQLATYDWVVFTSVNTVERVVALVSNVVLFSGCLVAAIGVGTADALTKAGIKVNLIPSEYVAESLLESFADYLGKSPHVASHHPRSDENSDHACLCNRKGKGKVLLPRAAVARDVLPDGLRAKGWEVDVVEAYRTVDVEPSLELLEQVAQADVITFTASSTVASYVKSTRGSAAPRVVACIGPITAETARSHGLKVDIVADDHTIDGLTKAIVSFFDQSQSRTD